MYVSDEIKESVTDDVASTLERRLVLAGLRYSDRSLIGVLKYFRSGPKNIELELRLSIEEAYKEASLLSSGHDELLYFEHVLDEKMVFSSRDHVVTEFVLSEFDPANDRVTLGLCIVPKKPGPLRG
jgi:hypothetical protein